MRELSLFTGAGGGLLGSMLLGWRTVAAVERDPYCIKLLCKRGGYVADAECVPTERQGGESRASGEPLLSQGDWRSREPGHSDTSAVRDAARFPIHTDIRTFHPVPGSCDIVTGGFPCQPHSQAGKRLGGLDNRDLWPDTVRVLRESQAPLGFFENVPGLLTSRDADGFPMFGRILGDLSEAGFDAEWCVLGADDVGAPHRRKRLWILAYCKNYGTGRRQQLTQGSESAGNVADRDSGRCIQRDAGLSPWWCDPADVGDTAGEQGDKEHDGPRRPREQSRRAAGTGTEATRPQNWQAGDDGTRGPDTDPWLAQPYVGRVAHGVASRVDRLRALGNGQVPQSMAAAFTVLARQAGLTMGV